MTIIDDNNLNNFKWPDQIFISLIKTEDLEDTS